MKTLSHLDARGRVRMVDVTAKPETTREAVARGRVTMAPATLRLLRGGRAAKEHLLLAEASEGVAPYGVVGHRHTSEIEQLCSRAAGSSIQLQFTPHLIPMVRGLLATVYGRLRDPGLTAEDITTVLRAA